MASVSASTTINAPVGTVFDYLTNVANHKLWQAGILEASLTPDGPLAVGSIYHYTGESMGYRYQSQMQVTAYEPNKTWNIKTIGTPATTEMAYAFEDGGGTTTLTITMQLAAGGYPPAAEPMILAESQKQMDAQVASIKAKIEGG